MHGNEGHSTLSSPLKDCTCTIHPHLLSLSIILYPSPLSRSHDKFCYLQQIWITTLSASPPPFPPIYPHVWLFAPHPSHSHFLCLFKSSLSKPLSLCRLTATAIFPRSSQWFLSFPPPHLFPLLLPQLPSTLLGNTTVVPPSPCSLAVKSTLLFQPKKKKIKEKSSDVSFSVLAALHGPWNILSLKQCTWWGSNMVGNCLLW